VPRIVVLLFAIDFALLVAHLVSAAVDVPIPKVRLFFDLGRERNLPTWYSSTQLIALALLLGVFAYHRFDRERRRSWVLWALAGTFGAMSLDEAAGIHEFVGDLTDALLPGGHRETTPFSHTGIWMFVIGPPFLVLVGGGFLAVRHEFRDAPGVLSKFLVGLGVFVMGAVGLETASNFVEPRSAWSGIQVAAEETFENLGITIALWAAVDLLVANRFSTRLSALGPDSERD
jgi:hypothetical protein